jgi:RimJ/RimL family protein N-acetyltransferase
LEFDIESDRLTLRTMGPAFLRDSLEGDRERAEQHLGLTLPDDWPSQPDVLAIRLGQLEANPEWEPWLTRVMALRSESRVVGLIGFHGPPGGAWLSDFAPGGVEFGYTVYDGWRRRRLATEASRALMAWATRVAGVDTFALSIHARNEASIGLARTLGFAKVGTWYHEVRGYEDVYRLGTASDTTRLSGTNST